MNPEGQLALPAQQTHVDGIRAAPRMNYCIRQTTLNLLVGGEGKTIETILKR
jgi:hypothetical protein